MLLMQCWRIKMYSLVFTNRMKHDLKLMKKRGKNISKLEVVLDILLSGEELPVQYKDHQLKGVMQDFRECHIEPDWLLIYKKEDKEFILYATATGTHADLFGL